MSHWEPSPADGPGPGYGRPVVGTDRHDGHFHDEMTASYPRIDSLARLVPSDHRGSKPDRWLRSLKLACAATGAVAVMTIGALVLTTLDPRLTSSFRSNTARKAPSAGPPRRASARAAGVASGGDNGPVLSGLGPSSGSAGQSVTLSGRGFFSSTGQVVAYFGLRPASTVCASQTTCRASVPPRPPGSPLTVAVTVTTEAGRSNGIEFSYLQ